MNKRTEQLHSQVLALLRAQAGPLSAYDVLGALRENHPTLAPPTIYRILSTLVERGRIHRIESLNSYIACQHTHPTHTSVLSICDDCGAVDEHVSANLFKILSGIVDKSGFALVRNAVELRGVCGSCSAG